MQFSPQDENEDDDIAQKRQALIDNLSNQPQLVQGSDQDQQSYSPGMLDRLKTRFQTPDAPQTPMEIAEKYAKVAGYGGTAEVAPLLEGAEALAPAAEELVGKIVPSVTETASSAPVILKQAGKVVPSNTFVSSPSGTSLRGNSKSLNDFQKLLAKLNQR